MVLNEMKTKKTAFIFMDEGRFFYLGILIHFCQRFQCITGDKR